MEDDDLGLSFEIVAKEYDRYRTGYPNEVVDDIVRLSGGRADSLNACEIGCGTGQATRSFAGRGVAVTCVEPGTSLLSLARANLAGYGCVSFINSKFEQAALPEAHFDLVFAAQSFHWVQPSSAHSLVSRVLKPGGLFTAFWKREIPGTDPLARALGALFTATLPGYHPLSLSAYEDDVLSDLTTLVATRQFYGCQLRRYPVSGSSRTADQLAGSLSTWSAIAALPPGERIELLAQVKDLVNQHGGRTVAGKAEVTLVCGHSRDTG